MTQKIYNLIILDESASMSTVKRQTIAGFNELADKIIKTQELFPHQMQLITFCTFNNEGIKFRLWNQRPKALESINEAYYQPAGNTPLFDAICKSVLQLKHELYHESNNYNALVTIITDGEENSSNLFTLKETKELIENMSKNSNWAFGLIGANINVELLAAALSIPLKRTISFEADQQGLENMFARFANAQQKLSHLLDDGRSCNDLPF